MSLVRASVYRHSQGSPADVWTITHNLGGYSPLAFPMVDVIVTNEPGLVNGSPTKIIPDRVTRISAHVVEVGFSVPRSGFAIVIV